MLDIDGVMIPAKPWQSYEIESDGFGMFNPKAVEGLNRIIGASTNPEILLSTSHKHSFTLDEWQSVFEKRGVQNVNISKLPTNSLEISRIDELKSWISSRLDEPFLILDDDKGLNEFSNEFKEKHVVLTSASVGLNRSSTDEAISKIQSQQEKLLTV